MVPQSQTESVSTDVEEAPLAEAGHHYLLRRDIAFLNHGSFGACPAPVFETYQRWQRELQLEPVEFLGRRLSGLLRDAREHLASYLKTRPENLTFVPNTTAGMNIVAHALNLAQGDEVLGTDHEYGAVERTWRFNSGDRGFTYRRQHIPLPLTTAEAFVEQFWQGVTEKTRVLVLSHITSPTALIFPVADVIRRARERGIFTVIDGAHAPSQIDLDLDALGADVYIGNCHKWLSAPDGSAFLYVRPEHQQLLKPLIVSWGYDPDKPSAQPLQDYFEWVGTDDPSAYLSVPAAIAFQAEHDWPTVRSACHALAREALDRISALSGLSPIAPPTTEWFSQLCAIPLPKQPDLAREELQHRLFEEFGVEVPITEWGDQRFVRVSIQAYNSRRDVDRLIAGLTEIIWSDKR